jgi:hypothetical protein
MADILIGTCPHCGKQVEVPSSLKKRLFLCTQCYEKTPLSYLSGVSLWILAFAQMAKFGAILLLLAVLAIFIFPKKIEEPLDKPTPPVPIEDTKKELSTTQASSEKISLPKEKVQSQPEKKEVVQAVPEAPKEPSGPKAFFHNGPKVKGSVFSRMMFMEPYLLAFEYPRTLTRFVADAPEVKNVLKFQNQIKDVRVYPKHRLLVVVEKKSKKISFVDVDTFKLRDSVECKNYPRKASLLSNSRLVYLGSNSFLHDVDLEKGEEKELLPGMTNSFYNLVHDSVGKKLYCGCSSGWQKIAIFDTSNGEPFLMEEQTVQFKGETAEVPILTKDGDLVSFGGTLWKTRDISTPHLILTDDVFLQILNPKGLALTQKGFYNFSTGEYLLPNVSFWRSGDRKATAYDDDAQVLYVHNPYTQKIDVYQLETNL